MELRSESRLTHSSPSDEGVDGNARLTATTGVVLFLVLALEGVTILSIRRLVAPHAFIGVLLIPPILLKLGSTGYRFLRYYGGDRRYRLAGPPQILLRLDAPLLVVSTVAVLVSGVVLWMAGNSRLWLVVHKGSFVIWLFVTAIHVVGYLDRAPRLTLSDLSTRSPVAGALSRRALVVGSIVVGLVLAVALVLGWHTPFQFPVEVEG